MRTKTLTAIGATCAVVLALAACGSDDEESGGGGGDSGGGGGVPSTLTIGVVTSLSGPAAATYGDAAERGVDARLAAYADEGGKCADIDFTVDVADDASSPAGALTAYQKLIQQDRAYAVLSTSAFTYGALQYLTSQAQDVPVLGDTSDQNPAWAQTDNNLFPATPIQNQGATYSTIGDYLESAGATKVGGAAFPVQSSQDALQRAVDSAATVGIDAGYLNNTVPFGSTDVSGIVLGVRDSGTDALYLPITFDSALAIVSGLRQEDVDMKVILAATGYGNDLLQSAPAVEAAQGVSFSTSTAPVELDTPATRRLQQALQDQGSQTGIPSYAEISGWNNTDLLLHGLDEAGCDASGADFISFLQGDDTWDGGGLFARPVDFTSDQVDQSCSYFVTLQGDEFVPVEDAAPLCGDLVDQ